MTLDLIDHFALRRLNEDHNHHLSATVWTDQWVCSTFYFPKSGLSMSAILDTDVALPVLHGLSIVFDFEIDIEPAIAFG